MGLSHFLEIEILPGMNILEPKQIGIVKGCGFYSGEIILIWYWFYINQLIMILEDGNIYLIFYFLQI